MALEIWLTAGLALALGTGSLVDATTGRIPDGLNIVVVAAGLAYSEWFSIGGGWSLFGASAGFASLYLVSRLYLHLRHQHGLGLGDAKLLAAAGAWLGPLYLAPVVLIASVLALGCVQVLRLAGRSVGWQTTLPFGPFLSVGFFACWCAKLGGWSWGV